MTLQGPGFEHELDYTLSKFFKMYFLKVAETRA